MHKLNWDDPRFVLAVARAGSVAAASRDLGVNHATVLRRVAQFEETHGLTVFDKSATGYKVVPTAQRVIDALAEAEHAMEAVASLAKGGQAGLRGEIRITSTDTLSSLILPRILREISMREADLRLELLSSNAHLNLEQSVAEISLRPAKALPRDLKGMPCGVLGFGVYRRKDAPTLPWLRLGGDLSRSVAAQWMTAELSDPVYAASADSFLTLRDMAHHGLGQTYLPCFVGDASSDLIRLDAFPRLEVSLWLASHVSLENTTRLARVRELLAEFLAQDAERLRGA